MVLNVFFYHQIISYDAWMKSPIDLEKFFLRLKIRPRVTFRQSNLLTFWCCKIQGFEERPPEKRRFGTLFQKDITFF